MGTKTEKPRVAILKAGGINCEEETAWAFTLAGCRPEIVHLSELKHRKGVLTDFRIVVIPGGFSFGDDIASGRVFALELVRYLQEELSAHISRKRPLLGICNGFQILVQTGLLPFGEILPLDRVKASLAGNRSGRFESRWVYLKPEKSVLAFPLPGLAPLTLPVAHGEGRFTAGVAVLNRLEASGQIVYRYCSRAGDITDSYTDNPNGAARAIAAVCDPTGVVFGLMPHPERFISGHQFPNWRRENKNSPDGLAIIRSIVGYVTNN